MDESTRPITPVAITLTDGQERKFLLSLGGLKRIKEKLKVKNLADVFKLDAVDAGIPLLWEALLDKGGMTEAQFADLLPADLQAIAERMAALLGVSMPDARPTPPAPEPETEMETNQT
jgi:hypothetical protein